MISLLLLLCYIYIFSTSPLSLYFSLYFRSFPTTAINFIQLRIWERLNLITGMAICHHQNMVFMAAQAVKKRNFMSLWYLKKYLDENYFTINLLENSKLNLLATSWDSTFYNLKCICLSFVVIFDFSIVFYLRWFSHFLERKSMKFYF